ncbi:MAG TPA: NAD(P)-dependent oxidoreductase [Prolixibacteraceae bacterium]|nr:NAD(P)-dependent oxidoreductase [Prolixibacteraceae bacterium]
MTFQKITIIDSCGLTPEVLNQLTQLSNEQLTIYDDIPDTDDEILRRIGQSDAILVSWRTTINGEMIKASPRLKYIGMCCSLYDESAANVDIAQARQQGIVVKGVRDYGDDGTLEFIFAELIYLLKGLGRHQWQSENRELRGKVMGIIGMGTLGTMVAKTAKHFGMKVNYFSRNRKYQLEQEEGFEYMSLSELMFYCDVISIHVPKNSKVLSERDFSIKKRNSILINTVIGLTFDKEDFTRWITANKNSFAIFDRVGAGDHFEEFSKYPNIIVSEKSSGFTQEAKTRLSEKVLENINLFLYKS